MTIDPTYTLADNTFKNDTDLRIRPNLNMRFLGYDTETGDLLNAALDALGLDTTGEVLNHNESLAPIFGLDDYIEIIDVFNRSFSLQGFNTRNGSDLILPALAAPELTLSSMTAVNEDGVATLSGTITDANTGDFPSLQISWGDGSTQLIQFPDPDTNLPALPAGVTWDKQTGAFSVTHQFLDDGSSGSEGHSFTISAEATDSTGEKSASQTTDALVNNVKPIVKLNSVAAINENGTATVTGSFSDPGTLDTFSVVVDWADPNHSADSTFVLGKISSLSQNQTFNSSTDGAVLTVTNVDATNDTVAFRVQHQYLDDGAAPGNGAAFDTSDIVVSVTDDDTGSNSKQEPVKINNVNPSLSLNSVAAINENGTATVTGSFSDPGTLDTFSVVVDWADPNHSADSTFALGKISSLSQNQTFNSSTDGAVLTVTNVDATNDTVAFRVQHQYLDDGAAPGNGTTFDTSDIVVTVTDDDTGSASQQESVKISNIDPVFDVNSVIISAMKDNKAKLGEAVTLSASFTDVGTLDKHTITINWDDGETDDSSISLANFTSFDDGQGDGAGSFTVEHVYDTEGGIFDITIKVTDDDTGATSTRTLAWVTGVRVNNDGELQIVGLERQRPGTSFR